MFINHDDQTIGIGIPIPGWVDGKKLTTVATGPSLDNFEMDMAFADLNGYGYGVLLTWKGYFWDAPVGIVVGVYDLVANLDEIDDALWVIYNHPEKVPEALWQDISGKLSTLDGQGQLVGDAVLALIPITKIKELAKIAKLLRKADNVLPDAPKGAVGQLDEAFHYTAAQWGDAIKRQGLRPGSYATPAGDLGSLQAKLELALPPTRSAPNIRIRIDLEGLRKAGYEIPASRRISSTVVGPDGRVYQMPGGGWEMQFPYEIPGEFLEIIPIR
jgi:hypothetical protein